MDRTIIAPWKAEEKELSELLYKKIRGLILLYTPSDELKKCLSEEMFLKPNQNAFFHVMHFLCCAFDAAEFKKRFYWPISDKRSESMFRTATVEYLKHLSDKHNLQWNIKSYLVVMPGGIKFINFLLDFIALIVKEITVQRERQLTGDIEPVHLNDWNIKRFRIQNKILKQFASKYISELDELILKYSENIALIKKEFETMAIDVGIPVETLLNKTFQQEFSADNQRLFEMKFHKPTAQLMSLEKSLEALKDTIEKNQSKDATTCNKINKKSLKDAMDAFNQQYLQQNFEALGEEINMKSLITAFNCLHADVLASLNHADGTENDYEFLNSELFTLRNEFEELEKQMKNFQKTIIASSQQDSDKLYNENLAVSPFRINTSQNYLLNQDDNQMNVLLSKYVYTPPIKLDLSNSGRSLNYRLPLLDQQNTQNKNDVECFLAPLRFARQPLKHSLADQSLRDHNSTMCRSKIIDPMQLLKTLQKSNKKFKATPLTNQQRNESNLSKLGNKWKERENLFIDNKNNTIMSDVTLTSPAENSTAKNRFRSNSFNSGNCSGVQLHHYSKKLSAVKKVQSASINLHNLSTSPSGRLEPLVHIEHNVKEVIKIQLNDATLNDITLDATKRCLQEDDNSENNHNKNPFNGIASKPLVSETSVESEEQLFNISDSVLKDISM